LIAGALSRKIARRIRAEGPLSIAAYMAIALHDSDDGYYARCDPIGARGDFITAPEISQVFGELIGLWCAMVWCQLGRPDPVILAELGPGRGVMIGDVLRAAATVPDFRRALRINLVEASAPLRAEQERRIAQLAPIWVPRFEDLPDGPMLLVANEFLDALPVRQFVRRGPDWAERMVALDDEARSVGIAKFPCCCHPAPPISGLMSILRHSPRPLAPVVSKSTGRCRRRSCSRGLAPGSVPPRCAQGPHRASSTRSTPASSVC